MSILSSIVDDAKRNFVSGTTVTRLILINIVIFIFVNIIRVFTYGFNPEIYNTLIEYLAIPGDPIKVLYSPWTIITSMFLHEGFFHLLWNMLFLYWFGRIIGDLIGDKRILPIYILGGLAGSLLYLLSAQLLDNISVGSYALGASGAIMAIVVAAGVVAPEYEMRLLFIGNVKLKYIVAVLVFLDIIGTSGSVNTGGHFAHIGGALMGWLYTYNLQNGRNIGSWIEKLELQIRNLFDNSSEKKYSKFTIVHKQETSQEKRTRRASDLDREVDKILDKIKLSGYESLTKEEKDLLFQASKED